MFLGKSSLSYKEAQENARQTETILPMLIFSFIDGMASTALVFIRSNFGERFFTPIHYILGSVALAAVAFSGVLFGLLSKIGSADARPFSITATVYMLAYLAVGALRLFGIYWRWWNDDGSVHSKSMGDPLSIWRKLGINHWLVVMFLEPALVFWAGAIMFFLDRNISNGYFMILSLLMVLSAVHQFWQHRDRTLDAQDAALEAGEAAALAKKIQSGEKIGYRPGGLSWRGISLPRSQAKQLELVSSWAQEQRAQMPAQAMAPYPYQQPPQFEPAPAAGAPYAGFQPSYEPSGAPDHQQAPPGAPSPDDGSARKL